MKTPSVVALSAAGLLLAACSTQQLYATGQEYRKGECGRIESAQERAACMKQTETSYEDYKKQVGKDK